MKKYVLSGVIAFLSVFLFFASCTRIDAGKAGVVKHFGAVENRPLPEGIHFIRPWPLSNVVELDITMKTDKEENTASSKDLQAVVTTVAVQYSVEAPFTPMILQKFGSEDVLDSVVLDPAIQESVKAITARYTAEELITKREEVKLGIESAIKSFVAKTLADKGLTGALRFSNVAITDFQFSKGFNDSIEAKVKAEQDALRAENEKKTRITQAEAAKTEQQLKADAHSYQIEKESRARADAIERESKALQSNPNLIQLRTVERWNGVLPTYTGNSIPFIKTVQ